MATAATAAAAAPPTSARLRGRGGAGSGIMEDRPRERHAPVPLVPPPTGPPTALANGVLLVPIQPGPPPPHFADQSGAHWQPGEIPAKPGRAHVLQLAPAMPHPQQELQRWREPAASSSPGKQLLLQACWDLHSPGGCSRPACKWKHCALDEWQSAWLRLQRFCFGGQLATFENLEGLAEAVRVAYSDPERVAVDTPTAVSGALRTALSGLVALGYPFQAASSSQQPGQKAGEAAEGGGQLGRAALLDSLRQLAKRALANGVEVLPVGSVAWGIDIEGSDLDVVVSLPGESESKLDALESLQAKLEALQKEGEPPPGLQSTEQALYGRSGGVPVLSMHAAQEDGETLSADVCTVGQLGSVRDSILFRHAFAVTPQLRWVLQKLKRWLRLRAIPMSNEGGYPQVFWMRLAARTFQKATGSSLTAGGAVPAFSQVREQLRSFCLLWSRALPGWGDLLNLVGEEPCSAVKRLATGVHGATALLCMLELRNLATHASAEELPAVPAHHYLCPAKAGYRGVFLVPPSCPENSALPELIVATVVECAGPSDGVRRCVGGGGKQQAHEYLSRRESDWVLVGMALQEDAAPRDADGASLSRPPRQVALAPGHFVCLLDSEWRRAAQVIARLRALLAEPEATLPPPFPFCRYSRRFLLGMNPKKRLGPPLEVSRAPGEGGSGSGGPPAAGRG